ncbi:MAG TPA: hypothetical protein VFU41_04365 [Gemmatimonadales bacterium]|nr:hypothetical protein [Gemmatimonadales bacterium]
MFPFRSALPVWVAFSPALLSGQESTGSDSTPFRSGQWAAQFGVSSGYASLGVLKFTAPTRAWLLDARLSGGHEDREIRSTNPDTTITQWESDASVTLRLGRRFYASARDHVVGLYTIGASGGFTHSAGGQRPGSGGQTNGWNVGVFFELGGSYLVTRRLSLGALGSASLSYSRFVSTGSTGVRSELSRYGGSLNAVSLVATVYF